MDNYKIKRSHVTILAVAVGLVVVGFAVFIVLENRQLEVDNDYDDLTSEGVSGPSSIILNSEKKSEYKEVTELDGEIREISISLPFNYEYDSFPQSVRINVEADYDHTRPWGEFSWHTPDNRQIDLLEQSLRDSHRINFSQIYAITKKLDGEPAHIGLFMVPESSPPKVKKGEYRLEMEGVVFEEDGDIDVELEIIFR